MPPLYLGVDVGTQSCKAVVWSASTRRIVSRGSACYDIAPTSTPGRAEQDPAWWRQAVQRSVAAALRTVDGREVAALAVSGQQHGLVPLDSGGEVIRNAKLWCDVEAASQAERLSGMLGRSTPPGFTAPKLMWLKENEPDNYSRLAHVLLPHDYINFWLTGTMAMECGDASGTGVFDTVHRCHDEEAIRQLDPALVSAFPELRLPNDSLGVVLPDVAADLGLGADVMVAVGSGDNMMSALGAGSVEAGELVVSLGTSGTLFCPWDRAIVDTSGCVAPFCDATGKWLPLVCTMNCTGPVEEVVSLFSQTHEELCQGAAQTPAGCDGVYMLPYFTGERTPNWPHAAGALLGLRPGDLRNPGLVYRAALEGSTFSVAAGVEMLERLGVRVRSVRLVGGGAENPMWQQIMADVLNLPVMLPLEKESAALGAALQAAAVHQGADVTEFVRMHPPELKDGAIHPTDANHQVYAAAISKFQATGAALFASGAP